MKSITLSFWILILCSTSAFSQSKSIISTSNAPIPIAPYSQAVKSKGMIYVAGQIGLSPVDRKLVEGGIDAETKQIMENIKAILQAAKVGLEEIVNTTIYIKDLSNFSKVNAIYGSYFKSNFPARTTVGVADLPGGASIEIAVIATEKPYKK